MRSPRQREWRTQIKGHSSNLHILAFGRLLIWSYIYSSWLYILFFSFNLFFCLFLLLLRWMSTHRSQRTYIVSHLCARASSLEASLNANFGHANSQRHVNELARTRSYFALESYPLHLDWRHQKAVSQKCSRNRTTNAHSFRTESEASTRKIHTNINRNKSKRRTGAFSLFARRKRRQTDKQYLSI